jgi:hypothetical protein
VPIIRRINCINTTSGIYYSIWMIVWCAGLDRTAKQSHPNIYKILIGKPEGKKLLEISRHMYENSSKKEC